MRTYLAVAMLLLACGGLFAQPSQSGQSSGQQSTGMSGMNMGSSQKSQGMSDMHQQMQTDMQQMKAQIDKMRSDAQKVQDSSTKAALLDNADLWDQFLTRMQSHMQMMEGMHHGEKTGVHHKKTPPASGQSSKSTPE